MYQFMCLKHIKYENVVCTYNDMLNLYVCGAHLCCIYPAEVEKVQNSVPRIPSHCAHANIKVQSKTVAGCARLVSINHSCWTAAFYSTRTPKRVQRAKFEYACSYPIESLRRRDHHEHQTDISWNRKPLPIYTHATWIRNQTSYRVLRWSS